MAKELGLEVAVIDDGKKKSGSRNAAGLLSTSWFSGKFFSKIQPNWWDSKCFDYGVEILTEFAKLRKVGEDVLPFYGENIGKKRFNSKVWILDDLIGFLDSYSNKIDGKVVRLEKIPTGWKLLSTGGEIARSKKVLIAAGVWSNQLLEASGICPIVVDPLPGRAVFIRDKKPITRPLRVLRSPYQHITFRPWINGLMRVGDTVEATELSQSKLDVLTGESDRMFPFAKLEKVIYGFRPVTPKVYVEKAAEGLVVATGGHRIGFGMSPAVAKRVLALLGLGELK